MPGDDWEKFANLRAYYGFMWGHPGKKLLFMGCEFAQPSEWNHDAQLDWAAAETPPHAGVRRLVRDLNTLYRAEPALHVKDCEAEGFQWIEANDAENSIYAFIRRGGKTDRPVVVICNFTPVERNDWLCPLPAAGHWSEAINTDADIYGGGNRGNLGGVDAQDHAHHGQPASARSTCRRFRRSYSRWILKDRKGTNSCPRNNGWPTAAWHSFWLAAEAAA